MLSLLIAATLLQTAPDAGPKRQDTHDNGMPKTDYELVAWCHGALAGQLELEPTAMADMIKIEGKAKVAARAKEDAEMAKERRAYLKDYEHALAAAEAASPTPIHQKGVEAELHGYSLWTATRNKDPIWLMLDWGMWDPNDVGCNEAAKRLYDRSKLFGLALKGSETAPDSTGADLPTAPGGVNSGEAKAAPADPVDAKSAAQGPTAATMPSRPADEHQAPEPPVTPPGAPAPAGAPQSSNALRGPQ